MLAVLEGEYLSGSVDEALMLRIGDRFSREGLLTEPFGPDDVRWALNAMNYRLRHARGEDDAPLRDIRQRTLMPLSERTHMPM